ncbi:copper resistance protein CopC [Paenibacillus solisilvae]|uniref:Copper resistance protein CopC n=1 Tax=Paenibacillus solisilvae TaxID=2486751 RepID=A0ABW0W9N2_9BACL
MKKLTSLGIIMFIILIFPQGVWAHTDLKGATPADGETVISELKQVQLQFETVIEPLVVLKVSNAKGEEIPVKIETGKQEIKGTFDAPLMNGSYTVNWRIIGEDGHNIKGDYSFTVAIPEEVMNPPVAEPNSNSNEPAQDSNSVYTKPEQTEGITKTGEQETVENTKANNVELAAPIETNSGQNLSTGWIIAILVVCIGLFFAMFRSMFKK